MTLLWRKVLECSSSLLTSSSLWSHSYGGRFWSVLPHTAHFVIHVSSLTSSSLWSHSLRHPCVLTPITCLLTHLIVIPDFSLESSHPSHPWLLTLTSLVLPLIPYSVFSHTPTLIALTKSSHRHPWLLTPITCATMLTHPRVLSHLTSLSAHTHHLSSHTHHLTSSVTTRTLTSFSLVSPHWVISHHLCSERVSVPTPMVSYYHQVYSLTPTPILVLPLTLPWCRTTTKSSLTPTPILVLPLTSFHLLLATNASPTISHTLPPIMPPSHHHHLITSSYHQPPPIASSHSIQFIPPLSITPNPPNRLLNPLQSQFIPITTIVAPHRLPNNIKPIQSRRWDKPQGLAGQSQLIPSQYPLHTKSSTKDCTDNTISFNTIQIVFLYPKRIKYSYVKYILSL